MINSVLLVGPDNKSIERALVNSGVAEVDVLGAAEIERFDANDLPRLDALVIGFHPPSPTRNRVIDAAKKLYAGLGRPIFQCGSIGFVSVEREFLRSSVGSDLALLKSDFKLPLKALYLLAHFNFIGQEFAVGTLQERHALTVGVDVPGWSQLLSSLQTKGFVTKVRRGYYKFLGLDDDSFAVLQEAGFTVPLRAKKSSAALTTKKVEATPVAAAPAPAVPAATSVNEPDKAATLYLGELQRLMRQELTLLRDELHNDMAKVLLATKVNEKLARMDADKLAKFEAVLNVFSE